MKLGGGKENIQHSDVEQIQPNVKLQYTPGTSFIGRLNRLFGPNESYSPAASLRGQTDATDFGKTGVTPRKLPPSGPFSGGVLLEKEPESSRQVPHLVLPNGGVHVLADEGKYTEEPNPNDLSHEDTKKVRTSETPGQGIGEQSQRGKEEAILVTRTHEIRGSIPKVTANPVEIARGLLGERFEQGRDIRPLLDAIALEDPDSAGLVAREMLAVVSDHVGVLGVDELLWMEANTLNRTTSENIREAIRSQVSSSREANALIAASHWVEGVRSTIYDVRQLSNSMTHFESEVVEYAGQSRLPDILVKNLRPGLDKDIVSQEMLADFRLVPVIAEAVDNPAIIPEGKTAWQTNDLDSKRHNSQKYTFAGSGPMGLVLSYRDIPQGLVCFEVNGQEIIINQFQDIRRVYEQVKQGIYRPNPQRAEVLGFFDFPGAAIEAVAETFDSIGSAYFSEWALPVLQVRSAANNPSFNRNANTLADAERIYDRAAMEKGLRPDPNGNYSGLLRNVRYR